jgi:uncharacterized protein YaaN involved in tellurite resistance
VAESQESNLPVQIPPMQMDKRTLSPEALERAEQLSKTLDPKNSVQVLTFGADAQKQVTDFSHTILEKAQTGSLDDSGALIVRVRREIESVDVEGFSGRVNSAVSGLPLVGDLYVRAQSFLDGCRSVADNIDRISLDLEESSEGLLRDHLLLDELFDRNRRFREEVVVYVEAARLASERGYEELEGLRAEASEDPSRAQDIQDMRAALARLDNHITNLQKSAVVSLQFEPMIRTMQSNGEALREQLLSMINLAIPLVKQTFAQVIIQYRQKGALKQLRTARELANQVVATNARTLEELSRDVTSEYGQGILTLDTLQQAVTSTIAAVRATNAAFDNARQARAEAEIALPKMVDELNAALTESQQAIVAGESPPALPRGR